MAGVGDVHVPPSINPRPVKRGNAGMTLVTASAEAFLQLIHVQSNVVILVHSIEHSGVDQPSINPRPVKRGNSSPRRAA